MHLALIMDGNGRWAASRSLPRTAGHIEGLKACKRVILAASELGVSHLTLFAFSTENWKRPKEEVRLLMSIAEKKLPDAVPFFIENNIRIRISGDMSGLAPEVRDAARETETMTEKCTGMTVVFALNYGGQDEIVNAVNSFIKENPGKPVTSEIIRSHLYIPDIPAPDMIARSAGERRLSNFMLWNSAYAELFSLEALWPDWGKLEVEACIKEFAGRKRRFGGL